MGPAKEKEFVVPLNLWPLPSVAEFRPFSITEWSLCLWGLLPEEPQPMQEEEEIDTMREEAEEETEAPEDKEDTGQEMEWALGLDCQESLCLFLL
jgi:hypothetical protein